MRDEIKAMTGEAIEARLAEIQKELEGECNIEELETEVAELKEARQAKLDEAEKRSKLLKDIDDGKVSSTVVEKFEQEERTTMNMKELRSSNEYAEAYLKMLIKNDDTEMRALLSTNVTAQGLTGYVPVPTFLESEIQTAWDEAQLMSLVKKSNFKGNVKVGFELSATGAAVHLEGTDAPSQEVVTLGAVEIKADNIKKWIKISDEAIEGTTVDTLGYIMKEIAHKIVEKAEEILVGKITALTATASSTAVSVGVVDEATIAKDTILKAICTLQSGAKDLHIAMNRSTYAAFRALELNANYAIDVFEGLKDRIVYTNALPAYSAATAGQTYVIVGDFGLGAQANFPNGDEVKLKVDDTSEAEADLVKVVGRQYVGIGVVADKAFAKICKPAQAEG